MKKLLLSIVGVSIMLGSSWTHGYNVQPGDNALLNTLYDRVDQVFEKNHKKFIEFLDASFLYELKYASNPQSQYLLEKITEYMHGKLYTFTESPSFICLGTRVQYGDAVTITYALQTRGGSFVSLPDGALLQSAPEKGLLFNAGKGQIISGIDTAVLGKEDGIKYSVALEPRDAWGSRQQSLILSLPTSSILNQFPDNTIGQSVTMRVVLNNETMTLRGVITSIDAETTTIDFNHPLGEMILGTYTVESFFKDCR